MGTSTDRQFNGECGRRNAGFTPAKWLSLCIALGTVMSLLPARLVYADGPREFLIRGWTREDGVPGNTVTAVAQTPDGYLWVGTLNGLARFDGVRFVNVDLQKLAGLSDPAVFFLQTDPAGNLWIGTMDGHLIRYVRGAITSFVPPSHETAERFIRWIAEDKTRSLWSLNGEGALNRLTGSTFTKEADSADIIALNSDESGKVWVAAGGELLVSDGGHLRRTWDASEEAGFKPECLAPAREGGCWVAGNGSVRRFMDNELRETRPAPQGDPSAFSDLLEDGQGSLWLSRYGGGITVLDKGKAFKRLTREEGLRSSLVRCLFQDREGNIWAGLEGKGLVRIRRAMFASYGRAEGLSDETVLCVCEGDDGEVWIGTNGDGVYRIRKGHVQHYGAREGLSNEFVWALHQDQTGRLWAGTWGGGLFRLEGDRFVDTARELGPKQVVLALHEDSQGRMWLGQRIGPERLIECVEHGRLHSFTVPGSLPRLDVRAIAETKDGSLWFATMEEGLLRWKNNEFTHFGKDQGLPAGPISALDVDDDGNLWAAVTGAGFVMGEGDRFTLLSGTDELVGENLSQITDDGLGYIWLGTRNGVVRVKKAVLHGLARARHLSPPWQRFSNADGLPSNECSGSGCRTRDGHIWFPTLSGVAAVDPRSLRVTPAIMPVLIEDVLVAGKSVANTDGKLPAQSETAQTALAVASVTGQSAQPLKIPPGHGPLNIAYTALSFTAPDRVQFRYQLDGLDTAPVDAGSARTVRYSYLPPGKYNFRVTACNEDGVWNEHWASLSFQVLPNFWQTLWFQVTAVAILLATTAAAVRWAIKRRVRHRMEALEREHAVEVERSRIAQDLHDDLGTSLTEISFLCAVAGSPTGSQAEVKGSLESITEKSLELVKALDEIVWAVNPKNDSLRNLVNYVCLFAQDFLRPASIQCRLDVPQGLPDFPVNAEQRHTIFLVTKEALANAAKHSGATEVWLRVRFENPLLTLIVEDNGHGFDPTTLKPGRNGMHNIEARMQHLGGRGVVRSGNAPGTQVEMQLRLG
jgi:ligand-binding sensor domain-containing protein/signal transduction histidine kinase